MSKWISRVLSAIGAGLLIPGAWVLAAGDASWMGASPEIDTGPPARIIGGVLMTLGAGTAIAGWAFSRSHAGKP